MRTDAQAEIFDRDLFEQLCRSRGWDKDAERARALGVNQSTIHRVQNGEQRPGLEFANICRRVFGLESYVRLFPLPANEEARNADR